MPDESTIFVVDDDAAVQDSLRALLESVNLKVKTYGSGPDFLAALNGGSRGCVVLDIDLPEMDGLEVLARLHSRYTDMPVILITGRADLITRKRLKQSAAVAFLEKPMREDLLLDTIRQALGKGRSDGHDE